MKRTDWAYAAGIIDGEGCIILKCNRSASTHRPSYQIALAVSSTNEWLCQYLKMLFGAGTVRLKEYPKSKRQSPCWEFRIFSRKAYTALKLVLPYLNLKRPEAELAISFQESKFGKSGGKRTDEQLALDEAQYILMSNLKRNKMTGLKKGEAI